MAAKRILTSRATQNMIVADDVYTSDDKLVIPEGTVLTEDIIDSLKEYGVFSIELKLMMMETMQQRRMKKSCLTGTKS